MQQDKPSLQTRTRSMFSSTGTALFQELLAEQQSRSRSLSLCQRLGHSAVLLLAWALSLSTVLGCVLAVHYFSEHMHVVSAAPRRGISCPGVAGLGCWGGRPEQPWEAGAAPLQLPSWRRRLLPSPRAPGCQQPHTHPRTRSPGSAGPPSAGQRRAAAGSHPAGPAPRGVSPQHADAPPVQLAGHVGEAGLPCGTGLRGDQQVGWPGPGRREHPAPLPAV